MRRLFSVCGFVLGTWLCAAASTPPDYFTAALSHLSNDAPRGWAYNLTTQRDADFSTERYDPSRPPGGEWTLLMRNGREPTAEERKNYQRYKASNASPTARATFEKGDIDVTSVELVREDAERAQFVARFRADISAPLLQHVFLLLTIDKLSPRVESYELRLARPFSPALGVRMHELLVTMKLTPPTADRPALPSEMVSRFRGRLFFFVSMNENLQVTYSDFEPVRPFR